MKETTLWRTTLLAFVMLLGIATAGWAGHHQTNPKHHIHSIIDSNDKTALFEAKLRIGWRGHEGILDQVKYELRNTGTKRNGNRLDFWVKGVRIVNKDDDSVLWSASDNKRIKRGHTGKHEWRGDFMHDKGIPRSNIKMQILLYVPSNYWVLEWDPEAGGYKSTRVTLGHW
ncbi:hypothetical protein [Hydrogenimonas urashimensis]|uniref:hypothetical protein n=1 Tax=Hydrogenimonas urashimensis TaxID=2740515 RepID=UPI001915BEDE|nr:hypothetical protein [Hydrogenimonas urashimensis]